MAAGVVAQGVGTADDLIDQDVPVLDVGGHIQAKALFVVQTAEREAVHEPGFQTDAVADHLHYEAAVLATLHIDGGNQETHTLWNHAAGAGLAPFHQRIADRKIEVVGETRRIADGQDGSAVLEETA